ncbi:RIO kinase 1 [Solimonas aquatica]|uniref:non-specific serine/threonine protein kinase n=1 Tax=Solimonas aquatica TaxID=489703 RepID=A0A1H9JAS7_9GAMM|nr:PA4780 family RIO1-like protein kinase [Solimonas aquatica]SEQ83922.1 RIO kinase 1 [Solimonas aquatica]
MKIPPSLQPLVENGVISAVTRQLKSGKEAAVFVVDCAGQACCAKVYKEAERRGFHKLAAYQEGRKARGSREARAMDRRSRHGRRVQEEEWKSAEVDALYRLAAAGVRVPQPRGYYDGVLLMELVLDAQGRPAPRLNEVEMSAEQARAWHGFMVRQIQLMLCAGLIHGDLSEFNVLVDRDGPVIIDLPQAVSAAGNNNAFQMLQRDVDNMRASFGRVAPELLETQYAREIWQLYARAELQPDTPLTGRFVDDSGAADVGAVLDQIEEARREALARERGRVAAQEE